MDKVYKTLTVKQGDDGWWVASTPSVDRDGDIVEPLGLDLTNWQNAGAPLLWGHDYRSFWSTIGQAAESRISNGGFELKPEWREPVNDSDPMTVIKGLIDQGLIRQLSIGFRPLEFEEIDTGIRFTKSEIMEVSAVNVAANQDALRLAVKALGPSDELEERVAEIERKLRDGPVLDKGTIPSDVSRDTAPRDTEWDAPTLSDFTDQSFEELSETERRRIAGHFAWAAQMPPESFGELKGPHHRPSDGAVVWRAITNLAARMDQLDVPQGDIADIQAHVASHYEQFDETAPWERAADDDDMQTKGGGEQDDDRLSEAEETRTEPESGQATRDDDATPVTDDSTEPQIDEDAIAEALTPIITALTGELINE